MHQIDLSTSFTQNDPPMSVTQNDPPMSVTQNDPPTSVTQNNPSTSATQNDPPGVNQSDPSTSVHKGLVCDICNKVYKHHGSLHHHMKRMHKSNRPQTTGSETILCKEAECSFHCRDLAQLRQYLSLEHGIEMMTDSSLELKAKEKLLWHTTTATEELFSNQNVEVSITLNHKAHLEWMLIALQPCDMHARHLLEYTILVEVCHSHYGHTQTLGHDRLPEVARQRISGQLAQGVTFDGILNWR